jgi:threonine/homoserine/homoserine lactone efflux protein
VHHGITDGQTGTAPLAVPRRVGRLADRVPKRCAGRRISVAPRWRFPETAARRRWISGPMWLVFLLKGVLVGIIIAVPVGPVGVLCIRRTIFNGRLSGFISGLGAATADAIFGIIAGYGLTFVSDALLGYQDWLRLGGAGFLLFIGAKALHNDPQARARAQRDREGLFADYASSFVLTITNPITILAFLAIFAGIGFTGSEATLGRAAILVLGVLLGSLMWWAGLAFGAGLLRLSFRRRHLVWINRGSGGILLVSGAALIGSLVLQHFH